MHGVRQVRHPDTKSGKTCCATHHPGWDKNHTCQSVRYARLRCRGCIFIGALALTNGYALCSTPRVQLAPCHRGLPQDKGARLWLALLSLCTDITYVRLQRLYSVHCHEKLRSGEATCGLQHAPEGLDQIRTWRCTGTQASPGASACARVGAAVARAAEAGVLRHHAAEGIGGVPGRPSFLYLATPAFSTELRPRPAHFSAEARVPSKVQPLLHERAYHTARQVSFRVF